MNLSDFFSTAARAVPAPTRAVTFKVIGSGPGSTRIVVDAKAELAFVDEDDRLKALRSASDYIKKTYDGEPDRGRRFDEEIYFVLLLALRDADDINAPFASTALQLRNALVLPEALRLWDAYQRFLREEFPEEISAEEMAELVEEAKKKSLLALLSSKGSSQILSAWGSLVAAASGESQEPTSSDTERSE
jgi:hypothetical protein